MGTPDCSSVLRRNVASMALQASLAFSSPTSSSPLSLRVARSLLAATPSPTPLPSPGQIRFKRVNIQKPRRPDWFRQQLLAISAPRYSPPQTIEELPDSCEIAEKKEEEKEWKESVAEWSASRNGTTTIPKESGAGWFEGHQVGKLPSLFHELSWRTHPADTVLTQNRPQKATCI